MKKSLLTLTFFTLIFNIGNAQMRPLLVCPGSYLSPSELYPDASGGVFTVDLISDCPTYTVVENLSWVSYTKSGKRVILTISSNSDAAREGIVSIGQLPLNIYQACGNTPGAAGSITGTNSVCPGQTGVNYYLSPISNTTGYSWSLPSGASIATGDNTNSITVNYSTGAASGNITVRGTGCGTGNPSPNYGVTVNTLGQPGGISGDSPVCAGGTYPYSISAVSGANSYSWSIPSGASGSSTTNTIYVTFGSSFGTVTVVAHNSAGCSSLSSSKSVSVSYLYPNPVTGGGYTCPGVAINVGLLGTTSGIQYKCYLNGSFQAPPLTGTGTYLYWSNSTPGTYTFTGVIGGCEVPMSGTAVISNYSKSTDPTSVTANANPMCYGAGTILTVHGGSLGTNANWNWYTAGCGVGTTVGTGPTLNINPTTTTTYWVKPVGLCGTNGCASITITVTNSPAISIQPVDVHICDGAAASLTASASGTNTYQWQSSPDGINSWINISGATSSTYSIPSASSSGPTIFQCAVTNTCFTTNSNKGYIFFNTLFAYSVLGDTTICPGDQHTIRLNGSDPNPAVTYKLYLNGSEVTQQPVHGTGRPISFSNGSAAGVYTVKGVTSPDGCLAPMNGSATVIVRSPSQPADSINANPTSICPGQSTVLSIRGGSLEAGYGSWHWYSGTAPCGSVPEEYGITSITVSPVVTTTYFVRAEGGCTPFTSCVSKTVIVKELPVIAAQPIDAKITPDHSASFSVTATGSNLHYQWQNSSSPSGPWTSLSGSTASNLIIDTADIYKSKLYKCRITSDCGTLYTDSVKIIVEVDYFGETELPDPNRLIDVGKEVGTTNISASVNPMGAATFNIPIFSSPGTNGMTPSVSINYNSQTGNDVLGYGWHIGGLSSIVRTGKKLFYDDEETGITFTTSDKFVLNGEHLMLSDGTYGAVNSVYFSESNPFSKITAYGTTGNGPTYFRQETKEGITYEYGNSTYSRHFAGNVSSTVYEWLINKTVDNNGNYIKYNYSNSEGEYWLRSIVYTGNSQQSLDPYDSLTFNYTIRTDDKSYFYAGPGIIPKTRLLQNITVYCEGNQVRKYEFGYTNGFYSQLVEITEKDKNGHIYNPVVLDWGNEGTYHNTSEPYIDRLETDEGVMTGDFNGDGIEELAYWGSVESGSYLSVYKVGRNNFQGIFSQTFVPDFFSPYPKQFSSCSNGDMDGDGTDDLIFTSTDSLFIYYGDQSEQQMFSRHSSQTYNGHLGYSTGDFNGDGIGELEPLNTNKKLINFDGDSRTDKIVFSSEGYELISSTSTSGLIASSILRLSNVSKIFEGDFNGDSQSDLLVKTAAGWVIMDYNGSQYDSNSAYSVPLSGSFDPTAAGNVLFIRDINNDGKSDIIKITGSDKEHIWNCYLSKGLSFKSYQYVVSATKAPAYGDFIFGDFNGEGQLNCFYDLRDLIELKRNDRINLVESAINGLNHKYTFNYEYNVRPSDALSRPVFDTLIYETYSGFVVNSLSHYGIDQVQKVMEYSYANPIFHLRGKGFLGFANQTVTDNVTGFTSSTKLNADETNVYAYPGEQIVKDGTGTNVSEQYLTESKKTYACNSYFGYISQAISNDVIHNFTDTTNYYYDLYGNDTLTIVKQNGELVTTTWNQFILKNSWCPARLSSTKLTRTSYNSHPTYESLSRFRYDNLGRIKSNNSFANLPDSLHTDIFYNNYGNILSKVNMLANGRSRSESYSYDVRQRFVTSLSNRSLTYSYQYDPVTGNITKETAPNTLETTYIYDGFGRQTRKQISDTKFISTEYDWSVDAPQDAIYSVSQSDGLSVNKEWYDNLGKQVRLQSTGFDGSEINVDKQYSSRGNITNESRPYYSSSNPVWNTFSYDTLGRIESSVINGSTINYSYNNNETTATLQVTGANRVNTVSIYGVGQVAHTTRNNKTLGFEYDNNGKLINVTPPVSGSSISYDYDARSTLTRETDPDKGVSEYDYNSLGELTGYEKANHDKDSVIYDFIGRDSLRIRENGITHYAYYSTGPGKGKLSQINSPSGYEKYSYDIYGNITRQCDSIPGQVSFPFTYVYDNYGRISEMTYPGGFTVTYHYNTKGYLESIKRKSDSNLIWQCNSMNESDNITQYSLSGGNIAVNKSFDGNGYLIEIKTTAGSVNKQWIEYSFDAAGGDMTMRKDKIRNLTEDFGYDVFDQLKWSKASGQDSLVMHYNDVGNITSKTDVGDYFYNSTRVHAVDSINGSQNLNRQNIGYNHFNKPVFIASDKDSLVYTYNVLDERIKSIHYDSLDQVVKTTWYAGPYEKVVSDTVTKHYYYINSPEGPVALAIQRGTDAPVIYYLCKDNLGSITGIMNSNGDLLEEYNYDPWGRRRNPADWSYSNVPVPTYTNHGYTSHEHLDMFNLINMNGRIYDSEIARFLSPDPIIQDPYNILNYNRYSYCLNNPLKYTDPSGYVALKTWDDFWEVVDNLWNSNSGESWDSNNGYSDGAQGGGSGVTSGSGFQGPGLPYMLGEVTVAAKAPVKNNPTTPINNNDYHGSSYWLAQAGAIAVTTSVADGPIPIGDAIGAAVITTAAIHDAVVATNNYVNKQGVQYTLRTYTGDIYKIGQTTRYNFTTNAQWRYSQPQLDSWGVIFVAEFPGNRVEILMVEKMKIWNYIHTYNTLPPGNKVPW